MRGNLILFSSSLIYFLRSFTSPSSSFILIPHLLSFLLHSFFFFPLPQPFPYPIHPLTPSPPSLPPFTLSPTHRRTDRLKADKRRAKQTDRHTGATSDETSNAHETGHTNKHSQTVHQKVDFPPTKRDHSHREYSPRDYSCMTRPRTRGDCIQGTSGREWFGPPLP